MCCLLEARAESRKTGRWKWLSEGWYIPALVGNPVFVFPEQPSSGMVPFLLSSLLLSLLQQRDAVLRSACPQVPTPPEHIAGCWEGHTHTHSPRAATRAPCPWVARGGKCLWDWEAGKNTHLGAEGLLWLQVLLEPGILVCHYLQLLSMCAFNAATNLGNIYIYIFRLVCV